MESSIMSRTRPATASRSAPAKDVAPEEQMYYEIYDGIMEHRLPAGTKLTEQALSEIYEIARHSVRKVLSRLAADGLVDLEPNRGAFIASPDEREAEDMFELRQVLERFVVQKVGESGESGEIGSQQLHALRKMVEQERDAYLSGNRPLWIRLSADFHMELARLSGNALLVDMLRRLVCRTTLLISSSNEGGAQQPCSFDEHFAVLDALEKRNANAAVNRMAQHLEQCACRMLQRPEQRFDLRAALRKPSRK
ncbi:GntR family transcriptional regulator [Noviherbaspirillum sp. 17J57-3]|uniref:GntR family transcriptional regulator n=2 Tax=Noviherbaspirillum galbum TaxID=2709383 RepID=A0A6B3SXP5_9BURK|nr:GntR family transcriptional regulator [Noviherbaspirillum galbum]